MQALAAELGISETAYLTPHRRPGHLRPALVLAGHRDRPVRPRHPGLGPRAARERAGRRPAPLTFHTRSGALAASFDGELVELDFPADPIAFGALPGRARAAVAGRGRRVGAAPPSSSSSCSSWRDGRAAPTSPTWPPSRPAAPTLLLTGRASRLGRRLRAAGVRSERRHPRGPRDRLGPVRGRPLLGGRLGRDASWRASFASRWDVYVRPDGDRVRIAATPPRCSRATCARDPWRRWRLHGGPAGPGRGPQPTAPRGGGARSASSPSWSASSHPATSTPTRPM